MASLCEVNILQPAVSEAAVRSMRSRITPSPATLSVLVSNSIVLIKTGQSVSLYYISVVVLDVLVTVAVTTTPEAQQHDAFNCINNSPESSPSAAVMVMDLITAGICQGSSYSSLRSSKVKAVI